MDFPTSDNYNYVIYQEYESKKCLKLRTRCWDKISSMHELKFNNSGLNFTSYISGYTRLFHYNSQSDAYWEQLKEWIESKINE